MTSLINILVDGDNIRNRARIEVSNLAIRDAVYDRGHVRRD